MECTLLIPALPLSGAKVEGACDIDDAGKTPLDGRRASAIHHMERLGQGEVERGSVQQAMRQRAEELAQERAEERRRLEHELELLELEKQRQQNERRLQEERARQKEQARRAQEEVFQRLEREEQARIKEAERRAREQEERERLEALDAFCKQYGFLGVHLPRRNGCSLWSASTTYPLHCAAELADARIVEMLLLEGADPDQKNSAGKTAAQVAQRKNKNGSHEPVQRLLGHAAQGNHGGA